MNKDDILQKARKENNGVDEVKRAVENEAAKLSLSIGLAMCALLNLLEALILETELIGDTCWIIYGTIISSRLWVYAANLKKKAYFIGATITSVFVILLSVFLFIGG